METKRYEAYLEKLREMLGKDISREELKQEVEKVVLYRPSTATDDVVAASVGLPTEAVSLVRYMMRTQTGGESMQRSRLCYNPFYMRLPIPTNISLEDYEGRTPICRYKDHIKKKRKVKEILNET